MKKMSDKKIVTIKLTKNDAELYLKYDAQTNQQNAYLSLNIETGELSAYVIEAIGYVIPGEVYHGIEVVWLIPALKVGALKTLCNEIKNDCQTILDHSEIVWNGSNYVGCRDEYAETAYDFIESHIRDQWAYWDASDIYIVMDAADYFEPVSVPNEYGITRKTTDQEIANIIKSILKDAESENYHVDEDDAIQYFTTIRDELIEDVE